MTSSIMEVALAHIPSPSSFTQFVSEPSPSTSASNPIDLQCFASGSNITVDINTERVVERLLHALGETSIIPVKLLLSSGLFAVLYDASAIGFQSMITVVNFIKKEVDKYKVREAAQLDDSDISYLSSLFLSLQYLGRIRPRRVWKIIGVDIWKEMEYFVESHHKDKSLLYKASSVYVHSLCSP